MNIIYEQRQYQFLVRNLNHRVMPYVKWTDETSPVSRLSGVAIHQQREEKAPISKPLTAWNIISHSVVQAYVG
jgi:hypothetical protein